MQHEVTILCGLLARGDNGAHDANDVLEHAALRLWKTLLRGGGANDKEAAVRALLHLEMKVWNRMPRLLFASSGGVVQAIVAVMCAATSHQSPPFCVLDDEKGTVGNPRYHTDALCASSRYSACGEHDGTTEKNEHSLQRSIHERIWCSEWWQRIVEKIEDCYPLCLPQQTLQQQPLNGVSDSHLQWSKEAEICGRLMNVIGAVTRCQALRTHDADIGADNYGDEGRARMSESIELFYSLCTSPIRSIAICASSNLLSILRGGSKASAKTTAKIFSDSTMVDHIAKWLTESSAVSSFASQKAASAKNSRARHENDAKEEVLRLQCVYFDLLVFGACLSTANEETSYAIVDKVNVLQLTTLFLSHTNAELQEKALRLLTATLQTSSPEQQIKMSVICSNIRISGLLIPICWFMGHSHRGVADAADKLMDAVIESSPTADILRALIEQGCAIIFSVVALLNPALAEPEHAMQSQQNQDGNPSGTLAQNCCELLDWMATEIVSEQVLTAAVSSVLRSSNVLLQKNVILSLLLLSQRNPELKQLLESEENFLDEVVHLAIEASEDGSLAAVLLEATLSWCDKCSALKLEDSSSFRQSKGGLMLRDNVTGSHDDDTVTSSSIPLVIKIKHKSEVVVAEVDGMLLYKLCKLVRRFVDTTPLQQSREPQIQLSQFQVPAIQLFTEVLPKSQQEAVVILKSKNIAELSELLELSKYIECSKCWHFTTFALNHALTVVNWFDMFQLAIKIRHPSLMLRAGKTALACFEEDAARNGNNAEHLVSQESGNSWGPSVRHFPELKTAAFELFQEVFYADKSIRNPDQSDQSGVALAEATLQTRSSFQPPQSEMLDVTAHMLLLLQQAQIKDERPYDGSFLPLSLSLACLLRQLPPGLAPPSGVLSFHQLDRLPDHILEQKLQKLLDDDDSLKALNFVSSIVRYVKIARALLSVCHEHLVNKRSSLETAQSVIGIVVSALGDSQEQGEEELDKLQDWAAKQGSLGKLSTNDDCDLSQFPRNQKVKGTGNDAIPLSATIPPARAVSASEIMKRAVSRDIGNGSAVLEIMRKYPSDERIQSRGMRALKVVVRKFISESKPEPKGGVEGSSINRKRSQRRKSTHTRARQRNQQISNELSESSDDDSTSEIEKAPADQADEKEESETMKSLRDAIQHVIGNMKKHPDSLSLQRDGLLCLSEYVSKDARHVATITSSGGIASVMDAMARLPDDQEANIGGLSVLAHPQIADESVLRVNPESRRLVLSAMKRFPLSEQIQGLSCLALANLSLRHDESMFEIVAKGGLEIIVAAMKRFPKNGLVQAAGCWLFGIVSVKNEEMTTACLDAGALPVCERARVAFPDDLKVQQNALFAIHNMVSRDEDEEPKQPQASQECTLQ